MVIKYQIGWYRITVAYQKIAAASIPSAFFELNCPATARINMRKTKITAAVISTM